MKVLKGILCTLMVIFSSSFIFVGCKEDKKEDKKVEAKTFCEIISEITGENVTIPSEAPFGVTIGADDSYCEIDTNPFDIDDYSSSTILSYIEQMNKKLELPDYLYNDMLHTSYSQGKQEETFNKIRVKYYYHPDKGLNVSYYRIAE